MPASHLLLLLGVLLLGTSLAASGPNVLYARYHNYDYSTDISSVSKDATSVTLRGWNSTIEIFDSKAKVYVRRIDIVGAPNTNVSLYSGSSALRTEGGAYFFYNASSLTVKDVVSGKALTGTWWDATTWVAGQGCITLEVSLGKSGEASFFAVTSGNVDFAAAGLNSGQQQQQQQQQQCAAAAKVLVGATNAGLRDNDRGYSLTNPSLCQTGGSHDDTPGYSNMDEPIGPLAAHYHTRGARKSKAAACNRGEGRKRIRKGGLIVACIA